MKITYDWLKDHLKTKFNESLLIEKLTDIGLEVESIETPSSDYDFFKVAKIIKKVVGFKGDIVFDSSKPDGAPRKLIDISRLTKMGWNYSVNFEEGLKQTYDWYIKNNAQ